MTTAECQLESFIEQNVFFNSIRNNNNVFITLLSMVRYLCLYLNVTFQQPFCVMDSLHRMLWINKYIAVLY